MPEGGLNPAPNAPLIAALQPAAGDFTSPTSSHSVKVDRRPNTETTSP